MSEVGPRKIDFEGTKDDYIVFMKGIVKRFPGVVANDHINFGLKAGEVHTLLGENGAGKTTLMNILYGLYQPDKGEIYMWGEKVKIRSPAEAIRLGIGMVHQHFKLVEPLTVSENIILGSTQAGRFILNIKEVEEKIRKLSEVYNLAVDPHAKIWQLSMGEKQRVEMLKMLYRNIKVLILDEPSGALTPKEVKELFTTIRSLTRKGYSVIFITHKMYEVMEISDRVTVLRNGSVVATLNREELEKHSLRDLSRMVVGEEIEVVEAKPYTKAERPIILEVKNLKALNDKGVLALKGVSFYVRNGEIFGIAGVAGNGQRELVEVIIGLRKAIEGRVIIEGKDITNKTPKDAIKQGIGYIPEERTTRGVSMDLSVAENLILGRHRDDKFIDNWILPIKKAKYFMNYQKINEYAKKLIYEFGIKTPSEGTPVKNLSGGNIQKLILARIIPTNPKLLLCVQPTRGLDVKATEFVRRKLVEHARSGYAVLLISMDLDEILTLSDRIAVIYNGEIMGIVPREEASKQEIGAMMLGRKAS